MPLAMNREVFITCTGVPIERCEQVDQLQPIYTQPMNWLISTAAG